MAKKAIEINDPALLGKWRSVEGGEPGVMEKILRVGMPHGP